MAGGKIRNDPEKIRTIIKVISETGSIAKAAREVGCTRQAIYLFSNEKPWFAEAIDTAFEHHELKMQSAAQDANLAPN